MSERDEILEALQDGLERNEEGLPDIGDKNTDVMVDKEQNALFQNLAVSLHDNISMKEAAERSAAPASSACQAGENASGGCDTCGFRCGCGMAAFKARQNNPNGDIFYERNYVDKENPPEPETTFPMPQILIAVTACVAGCFFAEQIIMHFLGR